MASTSTRAKPKTRAGGLRLGRPGAAAKGTGAGAGAGKGKGNGKGKGAARPVTAGKRNKPNPILLGGLGVVALLAVGKVAAPGLFGGGGHSVVASFPAPLTTRHLVPRVTTAGAGAAGGATATTAAARTGRDPFTPPPGFGGP